MMLNCIHNKQLYTMGRIGQVTKTLNPFLTDVPILNALNTTENEMFSGVSRGIKWEYWPEMV